MRVVSYRADGRRAVGVRTERGVVETGYADLHDVIRDGPEGHERLKRAEREAPVVEVERLLAPLRPGKIFGGGLNFASHMTEEPGARFPEEPRFFSQFPSSVVGQGDEIVLPYRDMRVDYEVEICFILGAEAREVSRDDAYGHIWGWTLCNDIGSRAVQFKDTQEILGKNADTFFPLGPEIVLRDEAPDEHAMHLESRVNGELRQSESAGATHWNAAEMIEWLSGFITLEPGDLVSMGTPAGCGTFMDPPVYLEPGDVVTVSERTTGLELTNPVVAGPHYDEGWDAYTARFHKGA